MALTKDDLKTIAGLVSAMINERPQPIAIEGRVLAGSYHEVDGTHSVIVGDTDAASVLAGVLGDGDLTRLGVPARVPVATHDPNDQYGPRGGEPVVMFPSQSGWHAKFYPDAASNDAPGPGPYYSVKAPTGERWIFHRNASGTIDSGVKLTNDGPTNGDGLGGTIVGHNGALTQAVTNSGHQVTLDDTAQQITVETASGKLQTILDDVTQQIQTQAANGLYHLFDGANNLISVVAPAGGGVALGKLWSALDATHAAARNDDLNTMLQDGSTGINIQRWVNLVFTMKALLLAMTSSGVPSLPTLAAVVAEMSSVFGTSVPSFGSLPSWSSILTPACSTLVRIAD